MNQFQGDYENRLLFLAAGLGLIPTILGAFWGAPLIAREFEAGPPGACQSLVAGAVTVR